jgi:hypothetical protein
MTLDKTTQQSAKNITPRQAPPIDFLQSNLSNESLPIVPPDTDINQGAKTAECVSPVVSIDPNPELLLMRIIAGERDLIAYTREGLNSDDLICKEVWRIVCKRINTIPKETLLDFIKEAHHLESRRTAHNVAMSILCETKFSNDEELIAAAVKLLRERELLTIPGTDARLRERGEAYGEHLSKEIRNKLATTTPSDGMLYVIDHAAVACIQLCYERLMLTPTEQRSALISVDAQMHALEFAKKFPHCENPWLAVVAKLTPGRILDWYYGNLQARSIAPVASDYRGAAAKAALAPMLLYLANSSLGPEVLGSAITLATYLQVSLAVAIGSVITSGLGRRKRADEKFHPLQREQLYKIAEEIMAERNNRAP